MKRTLSDRLLRSLLASTTRAFEIWDQIDRGFGVRGQRGVVSFFAMRRQRGAGRSQPIRITIGRFPAVGLVQARQRARDLLRELYDGANPREREAERRRALAAEQANLFAAVAGDFITRSVVRARTARNIERIVRKELVARWGNKPITAVTGRDIRQLLDEIIDDGRPAAAEQVFTYTRRLFRWALGRDYGLTSDPTVNIAVRDIVGIRRPRQRILTDAELKLIWQATDGPVVETYPEGPYVRLLLLLGQRRTELAEARWSEVDFPRAAWVIGAARMKGGDTHAVPLPAPALEILRTLPRLDGSDIVFATSRGVRPINDFAAIKARLDRRITALNGRTPLEPWTFHDCRRTFRTGLSTLGIAPHVAELCIAHRQKGLLRTYDLHRFSSEKAQAFARWAAHLLSIVEPPPANVVPLRSEKLK